MNTGLLWTNAIRYSLQIGLLIGMAAFVPALLRLRLPRARLAYWYLLLAACLILPQVRPWQNDVVSNNVEVSTSVIATLPARAPARLVIHWDKVGLAILAAGMVCRLLWLAVGFWRLRRHRAHSLPFQSTAAEGDTELRLSDQVASPVTFGWRRPVILLPAQFPELDTRVQDAILCHELLHVERSDWLFAIGEEVIRAIFWFHPAIWWLLGEIQLAREQAVDREVIARTKSRDEYVDALLAIAGHNPQADLAPAPLFLKKRHLKQRVISILKEASMSKTRIVSALAAGLGILAVACWFVTATFPLAAAPQSDAAGVTVDVGGARLMHRSAVPYPETARQKNIEGTVLVDATVDSTGNVSDARVLSGPEELRKGALQSVLQWHFAREAAGATQHVSIAFRVPPAESQPVRGGSTVATVTETAPPPRMPIPATGQPATPRPNPTVRSIQTAGLPDQARAELLGRLPIHEGDTLTASAMPDLMKALREYDEHLNFVTRPVPGSNDVNITIIAPATAAVAAPQATGDPIRVGGNIQQTKLVSQPHPMYPPEAKAARIQGVVRLNALIGTDGTMKHLEVISGHPLLVPAALEAVKNWVYEPTLLNGNPVDVSTMIDVNFTLSQ